MVSEHMTGYLLNYPYLKEYYTMIAITWCWSKRYTVN